jgi:RND family efflux transporter MFP subunit
MLFRKKDAAPPIAGGSRSRRYAKPAIALAVVVVAGSLVAFRVSSAKKEEPAKAANPVLEFTAADVATVQMREVVRTVPISGSLSPVTQSTVRSKVPGEVRRVLVREGERVAQGQLLAEIDPVDLQARLDAQLAALEEARARLGIAAKNRENGLKLHTQGFISQNALDTTQSAFEAAAAAVKSAEAQARLARNAMQDAVVRSPIDGTLARRMVHPGEKVGVDGALFTIVDLARMEVEAPVPASDVPALRPGQAALLRVDGFGAREFAGRLERINPTTEASSRAITVYLSVSNAEGLLRGGMFAKGSIALDKGEPSPSVPATAIREEAGQPFVFTLEKGRLERRPVTLGLREEQAGVVQVRSGLASGETVVSSRAMGLKAGTPAVLKDAAKADAKPAAKPGQG